MRVDPDPWLESILGYRVFRITASNASQSPGCENRDLREIFDMAGQGRAFYYAKAPTLDVERVKDFTHAGFTVVDVNVTFSRRPTPIEDMNDPKVCVKDIGPEEHEAVLEIAENSFVYSRFHLDPQIDNELANAVKREWVRNYVLGRRGERLLVAKYDGEPVGFLAVLAAQDGERTQMGVIDLIAVARSHQGRGIGRSLVNYFVNESVDAYSVVRVGTQIANITSMGLYQACGFHISDTAYVLHAHLCDGRPAE